MDDIRECRQRIFYTIDPKVGHMAIFVGTKVAAKDHAEFINNMELIDAMPSGLYEILITPKPGTAAPSEDEAADFDLAIEERSITTTFARWVAIRSRTSESSLLPHAFRISTTPSIRPSCSLGSRWRAAHRLRPPSY